MDEASAVITAEAERLTQLDSAIGDGDQARWVVDGNVVTAAGVSAGIDMALWLVGQLYDVPHARAVQRFMQYDPRPPYQFDG